MNYSLLHNDRALVSKLTLTKLVKVRSRTSPCRWSLTSARKTIPIVTHLVLDELQLALAPEVQIPLTAGCRARFANACSPPSM